MNESTEYDNDNFDTNYYFEKKQSFVIDEGEWQFLIKAILIPPMRKVLNRE